MTANTLIPLPVASLLGLVSTSLVVFAQEGPLQLTLKGGWTGASEPVRKLQLVGPHAYLVVGETGLQVLDVSSPTNPVPLGRYDAAQRINCFHVDGHSAYLATGDWTTPTNDASLMEIIDVSQPANLVFSSGTQLHGQPNAICATNGFVYVAEGTWLTHSNGTGAMEIVCVTNPAHPTVAGRYDAGSPVKDVKVADGYAYLTGGNAPLAILDVKDARNPAWVAAPLTNGVGIDIELHGGLAFVSTWDSFFTLDIQDPRNPVLVSEAYYRNDDGSFVVSVVRVTDHYGCELVMVQDSWTCGGCLRIFALRFFDMSDPRNWVGSSMHYPSVSPEDLQLAGKHAYMAVAAGLLVYEITELPYFRSIVRTADKIVLSWNDLPGLRLQSTPSLTVPDWRDVPGSEATNQMQLPLGAGPQFFRLVQPATP